MKPHLVTLEQRALELKNSGRFAQAAQLFRTIVEEQPDWEHGNGFYDLADCHEEMRDFALAELHYREALKYDPKNPYFLGGLASFLYLHGDPAEAFAAYLDLRDVERRAGNRSAAEEIETALQSLGKKIGLSDKDLAERIKGYQP